MGPSLIFTSQRSISFGAAFDGGVRIRQSLLFGRVMIAGGASGKTGEATLDYGRFVQARIGVEVRGYRTRQNRTTAVFAGADIGYQYDHPIDKNHAGVTTLDTKAHDVLLAPRIGADVGLPPIPVKLRVAFELSIAARIDERELKVGFSVLTGFGFAF